MTTKKILIILAFAFNIGLTLYGFATLLDSPYTGIRMSVCGDHACVKSVDTDSPAYGKVEPGDRLLDVAGRNISYLVFHEDPDYILSERDHGIFWNSTDELNEAVAKGKQIGLSIEREGKLFNISLTPVQFPFQRALARTWPIYVEGWVFLLVAYLIFRKKFNEISVAFLLFGFFLCADFTAANVYVVRDIAFPYLTFWTFSKIDFITSLALVYAFLHMMLFFPRRIMILNRLPWIVKGLYIFVVLLIALRFMKAFDNTYLTTYIPWTVGLMTAFCILIARYFIEKNTILKRQTKWVVFGIFVSAISYVSLTSIPVMFRASFISSEISLLPAIMIPLSFAFAITKYRLMEIDSILDTAVIYGFTIAILAGIETAFLSFASPYLLTAGKGLPALSVIAVLLIVFIYVPIRNAVKGLVERLFKRGKYDPEKELQQFMVRLGLCDERSALEKFSAFARELLKPSGVAVLKIGTGTATVLHADSGGARDQANAVLSRADAVWEHVRNRGTCVFGYELGEKGLLDGPAPDLENALFVPFITDPADVKSGYLAVLLKKWNETAYSIKDVTLLNAISVNIANIIEAGELRKERAEIENRFRKEKDAVMEELHDGLGNILTSITVTTQAAERLLDQGQDKAREQVGRIGEFSIEAMDFMRTGLTVLDNPRGDIGSMMEGVKDRFAALLESSGMELRIECIDDAARLRPGAVVIMNLVRVIQESLANIIKHSGARRARIEVARTKEGMAVTVTDDGKGFDIAEKKAGYGLTNMRRRIEDIGGTFAVESLPGKGTEIGFTVFAG